MIIKKLLYNGKYDLTIFKIMLVKKSENDNKTYLKFKEIKSLLNCINKVGSGE